MAWFKNWFNTHYYHLLYQHRDDVEAQAFVARLLSNLALKPQAIFWIWLVARAGTLDLWHNKATT